MKVPRATWPQKAGLFLLGIAVLAPSMTYGFPTEGRDYSQINQRSGLPRADDKNYIIWPKDGTKKDQTDEIEKTLFGLVDKAKVYTSKSKYKEVGVAFWYSSLTEDQRKKLADDTNVS